MSQIQSYNHYYPPVSLTRLHLEMANQRKKDHVEPEESFDLMLKRTSEACGRNSASPPPMQAHFNQFSFMRAGRTLELVRTMEVKKSGFAVMDDPDGKDKAAGEETQKSSSAGARESTERPAAPAPAPSPSGGSSEKEHNLENFSISAELLEDDTE